MGERTGWLGLQSSDKGVGTKFHLYAGSCGFYVPKQNFAGLTIQCSAEWRQAHPFAFIQNICKCGQIAEYKYNKCLMIMK